jgi:AraC-like DNA-binding protein
MTKHTISVRLVDEALRVARERGLEVDALLLEAQISPELMGSPLARVSAERYARLWAGLAAAMDDEFFGMDSHPMRCGSFRLMTMSALSAGTLGQALQRMLDFLRLVLDDMRGEIVRGPAQAAIVIHDAGPPLRMFAYATYLLLVHGLACWLVGRRLPLLTMAFRCPEPAGIGDYRARFCESLSFDAPRTEALLEASLLDLRVIQHEAPVGAFLREAPANLLVQYRNEASLSTCIRRRLRSLPPDDWPDIDSLASSLCLSGTTFQRRLQAEGLSYQRIKDELRRDIAIDLLGEPSLSVAEVAERVGFNEASAFHRAFKKWTGVSPGAYRRGQSAA